jgi:hypothetical protein
MGVHLHVNLKRISIINRFQSQDVAEVPLRVAEWP